ncbi:DNA-directed DNA polymerase alpha subunit POL12 [Nakaseomyces bracarensis]|uniref:DNA-directed DNA polymerase alpha subunit POL12 n=1 Tax=Nakaseomyces bracarensis TaxID=273131 RepID=UPI00387153F4
MTASESLVAQFGPEAKNTSIITVLENLMQLHSLDVEELYIRWEQFSYQRHEKQTELTLKNLDAFKQFLQHQIEKKSTQVSSAIKKPNGIKKTKPIRSLNSSPAFGFNIPNTPTLKKRKLQGRSTEVKQESSSSKLEFNSDDRLDEKPIVQSSPFGSTIKNESGANTPLKLRESNKLLDSLNPESIEVADGIDLDSDIQDKRVNISPFYDPKKYRFRTMRQKIQEAADVLDDQIETFYDIFNNHYKLTSTDFADPTVQSQSEVYAVGRIVPDSTLSEGFPNVNAIALETSRNHGIGRRIRLDLSEIKEVSLFLGQIVAIRGKNATGEYFKVEEVLSMPYPDSPVSTSEEIQEIQSNMDNTPMKAVITSGPYTSDETIDFEILSNFIERLNTDIRPHVVVMFGPFLDITHPLIEQGKLPIFPGIKSQPRNLDEIIQKVLVPILKKIDSRIQVVLMPSTRDVFSKHAAYPQDSFDRKNLQLPKNFKCFANPSTFQLNEAFVGCSNVDIYKDMKEITKGGATSMRNRFDRVTEHVLQQRRYYPVFPGGTRKQVIGKDNNGKNIYEHISGADLDVPYLPLTEFVGGFTPDILIIPSELQHFARVVQNVVVINPGKFVLPKGGNGSFAQLTVTCPDLESGDLTKIESDETTYLHNVWKRSRVDILTS